MNNQFGLIAKVMLASTAISVLIKYALPYVPIAATNGNASILVFLPTILTVAVLGYRAIALPNEGNYKDGKGKEQE